MHTVTKQYRDLPAAHRQPNHKGHCSLIHGHNWGFDIVFTAKSMDENGFVIDVGTLSVVKEMLNEMFDHTLLLNEDDPFLLHFQKAFAEQYEYNDVDEEEVTGGPFAKIITVPNCGMEGLAKLIFEKVNGLLSLNWPDDVSDRGLTVLSVTCLEDSKNSSTYWQSND